MIFATPQFLWLLLLVPVLAVFLWWSWRTKQRLVALFVHARLLDFLTVGVSHARQITKLALLVAAVASLAVALARPMWGFTWEEVKHRGLDIVVAIDTSRSMLAEDVRPNRLARAKLAALDLMKVAKNDRLALVGFAGSAFLQCPLTLDDSAFRQCVDALNVTIIPQGGTALTEAIQTALTAYKDDSDKPKILVLFTDGEDHDGDAIEAAKMANEKGLRIFTIGIGSADGELVRVADEKGKSGFLRDDGGNIVKSRLNETLLQQVAGAADGFYLNLRGVNTIETLYEKGLSPLPKSELLAKLLGSHHERFYWPLALGIVLLLLEMFLPDRPTTKRPVRRDDDAEAPPRRGEGTLVEEAVFPAGRPANPSAETQRTQRGAEGAEPGVRVQESWLGCGKLVGFLRGSLRPSRLCVEVRRPVLTCALALLVPLTSGASTASALRDYEAGRYEAALKEYQRLREKKPADARLHFNAGAAAYQARRYADAERSFLSAIASPDKKLEQGGYYNLGNAFFRAGEPLDNEKQIEAWEMSVKLFEQALKLEPRDKDAEFNRDFVKKKLEQLKQQQQQQQSKSGPQDKQDKQDEQKKKNDKQDSPKDDGQKQPGRQDDQKKDGQQKQPDPQEQKQPGDQKQDQQKQKDGKEGDGEQHPAQAKPREGQMTPQQAQQLLDSQKGEERPLPFLPPDAQGKSRPRFFKDW